MLNTITPYEDEHISSIIERFYKLNGFDNYRHFFEAIGYQRRRLNFYDDTYPMNELFKMMNIEDWVDFYLKHSEYAFIAPFLPPYRQVKYLSGPFNIQGVTKTNISKKQLKYCPLCMVEEPYIRRSHNLPGVEVCYKHGVPLETNEGPVIKETTKEDNDYAIYAKQFADKCFDVSLTELSRHITNRAKAFANYKKELLNIMKAYPNIEDINIVPKDITVTFEGFTPVHVTNNLAHLICNKCKDDFCTTVYGFKNDYRCPNCQSKLTEEELFKEHLATNGKYKLVTKYSNKKDKVTLRHTLCGDNINMSPQSFLDGRRCGCERKWTGTTLKAMVEKDNEFVFISRDLGTENINVVHIPCGKQFKILIRAFEKNRLCPTCDKTRWDYDKVKAFVESLGFTLLSDYKGYEENVTCKCQRGHIFTKQFNNLTQRRYCPECREMENSEYNAFYTYILEHYKNDELIFKSDLDREIPELCKKSAIHELITRKLMYQLKPGVYCLTKQMFSSMDMVEKTLISGRNIIGYFTRVTFLYDIHYDSSRKRLFVSTNRVSEQKEIYINGYYVMTYPLPDYFDEHHLKECQVIEFINAGPYYNKNTDRINKLLHAYVEENNLNAYFIKNHVKAGKPYEI